MPTGNELTVNSKDIQCVLTSLSLTLSIILHINLVIIVRCEQPIAIGEKNICELHK